MFYQPTIPLHKAVFAVIRCYKPAKHIRNPLQGDVSPCKQRTSESDWEETGQSQNSILPEDPELAKLIGGWSKLSDNKKKAIIKMTS